MSAVRFAVFAERAAGILSESRQVQAMPSNEKGWTAAQLRDRHAAKSAANHNIATFEPLLYPPDEAVN